MWIISVFATCALARLSYGQVSCSGYQQRIMGCVQHLQAFGQASSPAAQQRHCGDARRGMACLRDVVAECKGIENTPFGDMVNNFNMMEGPLNTVCPPAAAAAAATTPAPPTTPSTLTTRAPVRNRKRRCSRKDRRKLRKCSKRMQRYAAESPIRCGKMTRALDCMTTLMKRCSAIIETGTIENVNSVRQNILQICVETNEEVVEPPIEEEEVTDNNVSEEPECPPDYVTNLQQCVNDLNQQMGGNMSGGALPPERCQQIYSSLDCVASFMFMCAGEPEVVDLAAGFDEAQVRGYIGSFCPVGIGGNTGTDETGGNTGIEDSDDCPAGHTHRLMACVDPMSGIASANTGNIAEACSIMNIAMACVQDIMDRCRNKPDIEEVARILNLDQTRAFISSSCSGGPVPTIAAATGSSGTENCPADYSQRMITCVEPMKSLGAAPSQNIVVACRAATEGLQCLEGIINRCSGQREVQALTSMLNVDKTRTMVQSHCLSGTTEGNTGTDETGGNTETGGPPIVSNTCGGASGELERCNEYLTSFQESNGSTQTRCMKLSQGFDCFRDLIRRCPDDPAVTAFTELVDLEDAWQSMSAYCPIGK